MAAPTQTPVPWADDATYTSGPRSGQATKDTALAPATAQQGIVAGETLKPDQLNECLHNFYEWLQWMRLEKGRGHFGDGSDGVGTITGGTTTLTDHAYYTDLTVTSTGILVPGRHFVFVNGLLTVEAGGDINANGGDGEDGSTTADAAGGAAAVGTGPIGPAAGVSAPGATGSFGAFGGNSAGDAASTVLFTSFYRGLGGTGGDGGASGGGAAGGAGSPITAPQWPVRFADFWLNQLRTFNTDTDDEPLYYGGGGGGEGGFSGTSGVKGSGGGGGGICLIIARRVVLEGTIRANGGSGGDAFNVNSTGIGGGGGGGGGAAVLLYSELTGGGSVQANGGAGGAAHGTGSAGSAGTGGLALSLEL